MEAPEEIKTERLVLRRYSPADAIEIFECYAQDEKVTRFLTWRPHQSMEDTKAFVSDRIAVWDQGDDCTWELTTTDGKLIGGIGLRIRAFKADLGYVIGRSYWGNGYATEALRTVVQWALRQPQIFRVWAVCDIENVASARVMEKCGMMKEGVLRKWIVHPQASDTPRDCFCYALTRKGISQPAIAADGEDAAAE